MNNFGTGKDDQIKQLRTSNAEKDLLLKARLDKAEAAHQSLANAARFIQKLQQELSTKNDQIKDLSSRIEQQKRLREAADRRADESVRAGQNAGQQSQQAVNNSLQHRQVADLRQMLGRAEGQLNAANMRELRYLAEDERRVIERRAAVKRSGGVGNAR